MFKRTALPIASALAMLIMTGSAQAAIVDIAVNGDFETGDFTGWAQFPGSLGAAGQTIVAGNPGSAANLNEPNPAANIIKQANLLAGSWVGGESIDIQFDLKGSAGAGGVFFVEFFNELTGGGVGPGSGILAVIATPTADWTTYNYSTVVDASATGGITLQFNSTCGADANCFADFSIDNVKIFADVAAIPVPAAVWLFGSAIGLLGWMRRKVS
ncbi:MAG: hypothetical protein ACN4GT_01200 [Gammaproteobacteria bacterium]